MSDHTAGGHLTVPRSDHASRRHDAGRFYVNAQDSLSCTETHRKGRSFILSLRLVNGKNRAFGIGFYELFRSSWQLEKTSAAGNFRFSPLYGKMDGFDNCLKYKSKSKRRQNGAESRFASKAKCLHFCKMLVGERSPQPPPCTHGIPCGCAFLRNTSIISGFARKKCPAPAAVRCPESGARFPGY